MPRITNSKKDNSVSSIIGTITLLVLVVAATGIIALNVVSTIGNTAQEGPIVSFGVSSDPTLLYHAGGDVLDWDNTFVYYKGKDIREFTYVGKSFGVGGNLKGDGSDCVFVVNTDYPDQSAKTWNTGQFIQAYASSPSTGKALSISEIMILSTESGKYVALYTGSSYEGGSGDVPPVPITPGPIDDEKYLITVIQSFGGIIYPGDSYVDKGKAITFTIKPLSGHAIDKLYLDGNPVDPREYDGNTYTLDNVDRAHTISISYIVTGRIELLIEPITYVRSDKDLTSVLVRKEYTFNTFNNKYLTTDRGHGINITVTDWGDNQSLVDSIEITDFDSSYGPNAQSRIKLQQGMANGNTVNKLIFGNDQNVKDSLPSSYHFYLDRKGEFISISPDTCKIDVNLSDVDIKVKVSYSDGAIEYFYFNKSTTDYDYIPARLVGLTHPSETGLEFEFSSYVNEESRGLSINLTKEGERGVGYYTVQDISNKFGNSTLDYSDGPGEPDFGDNKNDIEPNKLYNYSIKLAADPSGSEKDGVKFLVTAYYAITKSGKTTWYSTEIITPLMTIPSANPLSGEAKIETYGYELGKSRGHGINITIISLSKKDTGIRLVPEVFDPNTYTEERVKTFKLMTDSSKVGLYFNSSLSSEGADFNSIEAGKYYAFDIVPIGNGNTDKPGAISNQYESEIKDAEVNINISVAGTELPLKKDTVTIPAGSPRFSDPNFPNITIEISGYNRKAVIDEDTNGHGVNITVISSPYKYLGYTFSAIPDREDLVYLVNKTLSPYITISGTKKYNGDDVTLSDYYRYREASQSRPTDIIFTYFDDALSTKANMRDIITGDKYYCWIGPGGGEVDDNNPWDKAMFADISLNVTVFGNGMNENYFPVATEYGVPIPSRFNNELPKFELFNISNYTLDNYIGDWSVYSISSDTDLNDGAVFNKSGDKYYVLCLPTGVTGPYTLTVDTLNSNRNNIENIKLNGDQIFYEMNIISPEYNTEKHSLYCESDGVKWLYIKKGEGFNKDKPPTGWVKIGTKIS